MLLALSGSKGRQNPAVAHSSGAFSGVVCLVAQPPSNCSRQGLCRLWRGLCLSGVGLVAGSGWSAADSSGPGGRGGGAGRDGGSYGWWAAGVGLFPKNPCTGSDLRHPSSSRKKTAVGVNVGVNRTPTPEKRLRESGLDRNRRTPSPLLQGFRRISKISPTPAAKGDWCAGGNAGFQRPVSLFPH